MNPNPTAENIEGEAARVRSQLVTIGRDLRHHADPAVILDTAKTSFQHRVEKAPSFLKENATPLGMLLLGGAFGAVVTGLFSPPRRTSSVPASSEASQPGPVVPRASPRLQAKAALISALGMGLGYLSGLVVPATAAEERYLAEPKAVLKEKADQFLAQHVQGMKEAAVNLFGASRLSGTALVALAMVAEALGRAKPQKSRPGSP